MLRYFGIGLVGGTGALAAYHAKQLFSVEWSDSHTVKTLLVEYSLNTLMRSLGRAQAKKLEKDLENSPNVNEDLLLELLQKNKDTVYGKEHNFAEIKSKEQFSDKHPLTFYEHYEKYIERIEKGENNILTADPVVRLSTTSGTSGSKKELPTIREVSKRFFLKGITVVFDTIMQSFPKAFGCQRTLKIMFNPIWAKTSGGIQKGPNSSSPSDSKALMSLYSTPATAMCEVYSEQDVLYMHLLFGLKDKKLGIIEANFASYVYNMFIFLEDNWQKLVDDIRLGKIDANATPGTDPKIRERIMKESGLKPDPKRASELKAIFEKGFSEKTCQEIWPALNLILTVDTGYFAFYGEMLRTKFAGNIPIYSPLYAATEGLLGVNTNPSEKSYTLIPNTMFYEFIPADQMHKDQPETKYQDQLEVSKEYELVITNLSGLCRYRFGDVVKLVGYNKKAPKVEVMYRKGQFLNLRGERMNEKDFLTALTKSLARSKNKELIEYACVESPLFHEKVSKTKFKKPRYMVYLELDRENLLTEEEKLVLDQELGNINPYYQEDRKQGALDQALVVMVMPGTFKKMRKHISEEGNPNQIKIPRVLRNENLIRILEENKIN